MHTGPLQAAQDSLGRRLGVRRRVPIFMAKTKESADEPFHANDLRYVFLGDRLLGLTPLSVALDNEISCDRT
jgi:hypothetical protein